MLAFVTFFRSRHRVSSSFRSCPSSYVRCLASDSPKLKPLAHFRITGIIPPFVGDWPFRLSMAGGPPVAFSNFHYSSGAPSVRAADRWERGCSRYHFTRHSGRAHFRWAAKRRVADAFRSAEGPSVGRRPKRLNCLPVPRDLFHPLPIQPVCGVFMDNRAAVAVFSRDQHHSIVALKFHPPHVIPAPKIRV